MTAQTVRRRLRRAEVHEGSLPGVASSESAELRELRMTNWELEQTIEILRAAAGSGQLPVASSSHQSCQDGQFRRRSVARRTGRSEADVSGTARGRRSVATITALRRLAK